VKFAGPVDGTTSEIEEWLSTLEDEMKATLKDSILDSTAAFPNKKRELWIQDFLRRVILITNQIGWT
jgi:hypothetical protein